MCWKSLKLIKNITILIKNIYIDTFLWNLNNFLSYTEYIKVALYHLADRLSVTCTYNKLIFFVLIEKFLIHCCFIIEKQNNNITIFCIIRNIFFKFYLFLILYAFDVFIITHFFKKIYWQLSQTLIFKTDLFCIFFII